MRTFTKQLALTALFTTSIFASSNNYLLLNDMKLAKQEIVLLEDMSKNLGKNLEESKSEFSQVLDGLINGNSSLNLRGTDIDELKNRLHEVDKLWKAEKSALDSSSLVAINTKMNQAIELYTKSYNKYLQKRKIATLVSQHINESNPNTQLLALYEKY